LLIIDVGEGNPQNAVEHENESARDPECIYTNCTNPATGVDRDGDPACEDRKLKYLLYFIGCFVKKYEESCLRKYILVSTHQFFRSKFKIFVTNHAKIDFKTRKRYSWIHLTIVNPIFGLEFRNKKFV
jgi:hypothetical protein